MAAEDSQASGASPEASFQVSSGAVPESAGPNPSGSPQGPAGGDAAGSLADNPSAQGGPLIVIQRDASAASSAASSSDGAGADGAVVNLQLAGSEQAAQSQTLGRPDTAPDIPAFTWGSYLSTLGVFFFFLALLWFAARYLRRRGALRIFGAGGGVRVESRTALGPRKSLLVVNAEGRRLLLGVTEHHISRLADLSGPRPEAGDEDDPEHGEDAPDQADGPGQRPESPRSERMRPERMRDDEEAPDSVPDREGESPPVIRTSPRRRKRKEPEDIFEALLSAGDKKEG
ncbi:flagellar biosynthetic protein FliO [Desulfovibrio sp. OttesenSCG-928-C14]|nr:flagellar biosynthetic protein FliO [Desulfovibrio sp. OttesenSCG-928-C14]